MLFRIAVTATVWEFGSWSGEWSVQFAKIHVVLSAKALQDHDTVISVIDAVVAGKKSRKATVLAVMGGATVLKVGGHPGQFF